jgi:hypothetical protein
MSIGNHHNELSKVTSMAIGIETSSHLDSSKNKDMGVPAWKDCTLRLCKFLT